jgi:hypothetical protein
MEGLSGMSFILKNEFATVEVERDDNANGPRLMVRDMRSGRRIYLDPLELAALVWTRHGELLPFLDPSRLDPENSPGKER